jgi:hypothetical protein
MMTPHTIDTWFLEPVTEEQRRNHDLAPLIAKATQGYPIGPEKF